MSDDVIKIRREDLLNVAQALSEAKAARIRADRACAALRVNVARMEDIFNAIRVVDA